ncbi:VOC family protein [Phytomonospora sp. NPDC050363]|uniref:VOC family protein n=1 Tax=Phytomonospora sp. NPDC050363 TaxID=3155642 RepID=UPI0033CD8934
MVHLGEVVLVVRDYDEAIAYYVDRLGFELVEDTELAPGKRWVKVRPAGTPGAALLLAKAVGEHQESRIGDQTGGRVAFFLYTDDFARDHRRMLDAGVAFEEEPRHEPFGTVAVFADLYGNRWDFIERKTA